MNSLLQLKKRWPQYFKSIETLDKQRVRDAFKELRISMIEEFSERERKYQIPESDIVSSEFDLYEKELGL